MNARRRRVPVQPEGDPRDDYDERGWDVNLDQVVAHSAGKVDFRYESRVGAWVGGLGLWLAAQTKTRMRHYTRLRVSAPARPEPSVSLPELNSSRRYFCTVFTMSNCGKEI